MRLFLLLVLIANHSFAAKVNIEMWTRAAGHYHTGQTPKVKKALIDISDLTQEAIQRRDIQYSSVRKYQGVFLRTLVQAYSPDLQRVDSVLLHFANGMVIPVRIDEMPDSPAILIALKTYENKKWTRTFPSSARKMSGVKDKHPLRFDGNKVVVSQQWAVKFDYQGKRLFTPWMHVDSLRGLEFINADAYFKQFRDESGKDSLQGFVVYLRRCQFCHGINGVGADYGPDFLQYPALHQKLDVTRLIKHVRNEKPPLVKTELNMPNQNDISDQEVKELWRWTKSLNIDKVGYYKP